jgi:hypothetical protein
MTVQTQGFTTQGASPGQQSPFSPGFPTPPGAEQLFGVQQPYSVQSPYGQPSPYGYQQWPQTQPPYGAQAPSGAQQIIQQLAQILATAQQIIVPQAAGLAVQQVCQQLPQLIAQLAMQQSTGQQPGAQQFTGQPAWPWAQPMGTMPGQAGRPLSFLS